MTATAEQLLIRFKALRAEWRKVPEKGKRGWRICSFPLPLMTALHNDNAEYAEALDWLRRRGIPLSNRGFDILIAKMERLFP